MLIQASAFNGCCAIYGSRYRQANGQAFRRPGPDGDAALEVAYGDLRRAFRFFLEEHSEGRPFILAGHSQGSALAARLLREEISGSLPHERLVVAYLIGGPINTVPSPGVPTRSAPGQTGCLGGGVERKSPAFRRQRARLSRRR
jgi:pimeloyl-ACP methyl ester carboxylesterase